MVTFTHKLGLLFAQMQESASVGAHSYSLISLGLLSCFLHESIMPTRTLRDQTWILNFLCDAKTINQSLLFFNFPFLNVILILHGFQFFGQKLILFSELFSGDGQPFIFFLSINQIRSDSAEFFFSLIDFIHVAACLESRFFNQL